MWSDVVLCSALQHVYRATVVARLTYAVSAWRRFTEASDRQRINTVIRPTPRILLDELCDAADDEPFSRAVRLSNHVLHALLPSSSTASQRCNLTHRAHAFQLPEHSTQLSDSMLYKNTY